MKLTINNIRWINNTFKFNNLNVLTGENWSGKSSIINLIKDMLRGKTDIKEWWAMLNYWWKDDENKMNINIQNGRIFESPHIDMDLSTPWFLMGKGKLISGINKSMEDRRKTISDFLKIDRDWFFKKEWVSPDIKWLTSELKTLRTKESVLTWELMEKESLSITNIDKPKEVKLVQSTLSNQWELDNLNSRLENIKYEDCPIVEINPKKVILIQWNELEYNNLKKELVNITTEGRNIPVTCPTCWQDIKDAEQMKAALRVKYNEKVKEIKSFNIVSSNIELYEQYRSDLEKYNKRNLEIQNIDLNNKRKTEEINDLKQQIKDFKLIKSTNWNEKEYEAYQTALSNYNSNKQIIKSREEDIEKIKEKIKAIPTIDIEAKIKKYKETELKFVESLKDKLKVGDLEFIFYTELKSPNINWESFKSTFEIKYKGKNYNECSSWEQGIIDVMIAYLFLEDRPLLIDNWEISDEKLKEFIKDYWKDITIICTRISDWDLKLTHKL